MNARLAFKLLTTKSDRPMPIPTRLKPALSDPVEAEETLMRARAQSLLCGTPFLDGSSQCPPLTLEQARDVLAWAGRKPNTQTPPMGGKDEQP